MSKSYSYVFDNIKGKLFLFTGQGAPGLGFRNSFDTAIDLVKFNGNYLG